MPQYSYGEPEVDWLEFLVRKLGQGSRPLHDLIKISRAAQAAVRDEIQRIEQAKTREEVVNG
jgi:hypothetical protein